MASTLQTTPTSNTKTTLLSTTLAILLALIIIFAMRITSKEDVITPTGALPSSKIENISNSNVNENTRTDTLSPTTPTDSIQPSKQKPQ